VQTIAPVITVGAAVFAGGESDICPGALKFFRQELIERARRAEQPPINSQALGGGWTFGSKGRSSMR